MAHALDLHVVAGGVETSDKAQILGMLGCDFAQDYLYARPCRWQICANVLSRGGNRTVRNGRGYGDRDFAMK